MAKPQVLSRNETVKEDRDQFVNCKVHPRLCLTVVVLGASGDLAKKKTFPALYELYCRGFLPKDTHVLGYARSAMSNDALRDRLKAFMPSGPEHEERVDVFLSHCTYLQGQYDGNTGYEDLNQVLTAREFENDGVPHGRLFYLALPPTVYPQVCKGLSDHCCEMVDSPGSWLRLIVEKPFGHDLESSNLLADQLGKLFPEEQIYRIDHYLGKELSQNMLIMRFANAFLLPVWNRNYVDNVQITFKEPFGTEGRGGYFDASGIIRDVLQNHLLQVLALMAMEKPVSMHADDIRDEKLKVLRCMEPVEPHDCVLGQYTAANGKPGYLDDDTVPQGSKTPTFATCIMRVNNDRWAGVPFVLKAGKALNERKVEVRVQLRSVPAYQHGDAHGMRNEFVMRIQPDEAIYLKMVVKKPGLEMEPTMSELDLSYNKRHVEERIPDAYERLILDAIRGDQQHFVRSDELRAAWTVFTPLLHKIDAGEIDPLPYAYGSRGPAESDELIGRAGFVKGQNYEWRDHTELSSSSMNRHSLEIESASWSIRSEEFLKSGGKVVEAASYATQSST